MTPNLNVVTALGAGLLSFVSPCVLPLVPAYLSFLTGSSVEELRDGTHELHRMKIFLHAVAFTLGFSFIFITVFGLGSTQSPVLRTSTIQGPIVHQVHGVVIGVNRDALRLRLRDGREMVIDIGRALAARHAGVLPIGGAVVVYGSIDRAGTFHATSVGHTSQNPKDWTPDD